MLAVSPLAAGQLATSRSSTMSSLKILKACTPFIFKRSTHRRVWEAKAAAMISISRRHVLRRIKTVRGWRLNIALESGDSSVKLRILSSKLARRTFAFPMLQFVEWCVIVRKERHHLEALDPIACSDIVRGSRDFKLCADEEMQNMQYCSKTHFTTQLVSVLLHTNRCDYSCVVPIESRQDVRTAPPKNGKKTSRLTCGNPPWRETS